jgi:hypothetical protein
VRAQQVRRSAGLRKGMGAHGDFLPVKSDDFLDHRFQ